MKGLISVSVVAMAVSLAVAATPALALQTNEQQAGNPASSDDGTQPATGGVSTAKVAAAEAGLAGNDTGTDKRSAEDIIVTGTRLGRPNITSTAPILTVTAAEIKQQGAINVSDVLNRLPQVAPDNQSVYQDSNGAQRVELRGFGFNRTLSLIDGQRIATSEGVNVNAIPVALVERIDVLTGGAASIYGADAVAGVINFVLKKDFEGLQINGSYSGYTHDNDGHNLGAQIARASGTPGPGGLSSGGGTANLSAAFGHKFFDRLSVSLFGNYIHTDPILVDDRDFSSCYLTQRGQPNTVPVCQTVTGKTPFGTFTPASGPNQGIPFSDARDGSRAFILSDSGNAYQPFDGNYLQQPVERYNAGAFVNLDITDNLAAFANYMMTYSRSYVQHGGLYSGSSGIGGNSTTTYNINCNNPLLSGQQQVAFCGASAGTATQVPFNLQYVPNVLFRDRYDNFDQRVTAGLRGKFFNDALKFDANFLFSSFKNTQLAAPNNSTPSADRVQQSLLVGGTTAAPTCLSGTAGCVPADIFRYGDVNPALVGWLYGTTPGKAVNNGLLYDYTGNVQLDLGKFGVKSPGADDGLALGGGLEYRKDRQLNTVDAAFLTQKGGGNFEREQDVKEAYVEGNLPLLQDKLYTHLLSVTGSYRWSKYSSSPQTFTTWQVGGLYSPVSDVTFRASFNKASRQATLYEIGSPVFEFVRGSRDPCATTPAVPPTPGNPTGTAAIPPSASLQDCQKTGVTPAQYGNIPQCADNSCLARSGGGVVQPETAHTQTYGILLKPRFIPGLTLSVDRFDITIDNSIGYSYDSDFMNGCLQFGIPFYCNNIRRNSDGSLTSASTYQQGTTPNSGFVIYGTFNGYKYISRGYDFQGQYTVPVAPIAGTLNFLFNGTLTKERGGKDDPTFTASRNSAGYFGPFAGIPRPKWAHTLRTTYTTNDNLFTASVNWRYIGGTTASQNSGDPLIGGTDARRLTLFNKLPAYSYFDTSLSVNISKRYILSFVVNNIFDKTVPVLPDTNDQYNSRSNTITKVYDPLGRFLQVGVTMNF